MIKSIYKALFENNKNLAKIIEGLIDISGPIQYDYRSYIKRTKDSNNQYITYRRILELDFENDKYDLTCEEYEYDDEKPVHYMLFRKDHISNLLEHLNQSFDYEEEYYKKEFIHNYELYRENADELISQITEFQNEAQNI